MRTALYGPDGFFVRERPADHFRTSAQSPHFARAIALLAADVDRALGSPEVFDLVDVGAGRGELLHGVLAALPAPLRARVRPVAVEVSARGGGEPGADGALAGVAPRTGAVAGTGVSWRTELPRGLTGLLLATEWLDNVPLDLARDGSYLDTDLNPCGPLDPADAAWIERWWPAGPDDVVEVGRSRDEAWADAVGALDAGLALAVDYGHRRGERPVLPTVTGFRGGREVPPVFDGSTDITCHVAMDSVAVAAQARTREVAGPDAQAATSGGPEAGWLLLDQRTALHRLDVTAARPPLGLASTDPVGYVRALAAASEIGELTATGGLGGHWWLAQWPDLDARQVPLLRPHP
ncbi:SAM-dependent methyltransferase [Catellatospora vulcania]|uniref:SAM-dependent methyltransferase n=1 Tax=Catellatospora vulcania TaxID=1460450 RepID=UPI0012D44804|nr:SAM-dependent methyltransferase [Catellatospora vulcania]